MGVRKVFITFFSGPFTRQFRVTKKYNAKNVVPVQNYRTQAICCLYNVEYSILWKEQQVNIYIYIFLNCSRLVIQKMSQIPLALWSKWAKVDKKGSVLDPDASLPGPGNRRKLSSHTHKPHTLLTLYTLHILFTPHTTHTTLQYTHSSHTSHTPQITHLTHTPHTHPTHTLHTLLTHTCTRNITHNSYNKQSYTLSWHIRTTYTFMILSSHHTHYTHSSHHTFFTHHTPHKLLTRYTNHIPPHWSEPIFLAYQNFKIPFVHIFFGGWTFFLTHRNDHVQYVCTFFFRGTFNL